MFKGGEAKLTSYCPAQTKQEGGIRDCLGYPLQPLDTWLDGKQGIIKIVGGVELWTEEDGQAPWVTVAMDLYGVPMGTPLYIPKLNKAFGREIPFVVRDNGEHFNGKTGWGAMDICRRLGIDPKTGELYMFDPLTNEAALFIAWLKSDTAQG